MTKLEERKESLRQLAKLLITQKDKKGLVAIYPHLGADGDAYGASFALTKALEKLGISARTVLNEAIDLRFSYLDGETIALDWSALAESDKRTFLLEQTLSLMIDVSVMKRLDIRQEAYLAAEKKLILDHHISELENNEDIYIFPAAAASCELVYDLLYELEDITGELIIDHEIALALYTGILTDTGNFSHPNVKPHTLEIAAHLLRKEINLPRLTDHLFRLTSWEAFYAEGVLRTQVKSACEGKIRYLTVTRALLDGLEASDSAIDKMPGEMRAIEGTLVAMMLRETESGEIRVNLRSVPDLDIRVIAEHFGGGGHKNASGVTFRDCSLDEAKDKLLSKIVEYLISYEEK